MFERSSPIFQIANAPPGTPSTRTPNVMPASAMGGKLGAAPRPKEMVAPVWYGSAPMLNFSTEVT